MSASFPEPTVADARAANKLVAHAKEHNITLTLWSIPETSLRRIAITDSAFDTSGQQRSQHGWLIGYSTPDLAAGKSRARTGKLKVEEATTESR